MDATSGFRTRLREALERKGLSQTELARQLGVRVATVNEWLNRETMPSGAIMLHLPKVLSVDGHWLLTGERRALQGDPAFGSDQLHRASALLSEALRVLNTREAGGAAAGRSGDPGRVRKPRSTERVALEAAERHPGTWEQTEPRRGRTSG